VVGSPERGKRKRTRGRSSPGQTRQMKQHAPSLSNPASKKRHKEKRREANQNEKKKKGLTIVGGGQEGRGG